MKPASSGKTANEMPSKHTTNVNNQREPLSNFLKMPKNDEWQLSKNSGIASAKYELVFEDKTYELSIIRMNAKVELEEVLSIWQNKVGLVAKSQFTSTTFLTNTNQKLDLIPLIGKQKTVLLAVHKAQKYTFFRLLSNQKTEEKVTQKFKNLLMEIEIIN